MWSKRKEEDAVFRPIQPAHAPVPENGGSAHPIRTYDGKPVTEGGVSTFARNVIVKGKIFSGENLVVDGEMEGSIDCPEHRLTIGANARVKADLKARELLILGAVEGNVDAADNVELKKDAKLVGDIRTGRLLIEEGARFNGNIQMIEASAPAVVSIHAGMRAK
jgi:cytoskeletal protein CcmA (bactofilin family)